MKKTFCAKYDLLDFCVKKIIADIITLCYDPPVMIYTVYCTKYVLVLESSCNPQEPKPRICYPTQFGVFGLQSLEWQLGAAEVCAHMYTHVFVYLV